jgi:hypothetical protein
LCREIAGRLNSKHQVEGNKVKRVAIGREFVRARATMCSDASHAGVQLSELALHDLLSNHSSASS